MIKDQTTVGKTKSIIERTLRYGLQVRKWLHASMERTCRATKRVALVVIILAANTSVPDPSLNVYLY